MMFDDAAHRTASSSRSPGPRNAVERLRQLIEEARLRPGDQIPPQRELAERLGISRATLREALSALESLGLVSVQAGRGVYVAEPSGAMAWRFADRCTPREIYEARSCIEVFVAGLAASRLDQGGLDEMERSVAALRAACDRQDLSAMASADSAFHDLIVAACANPVLAAMYRSVREMAVESQRLPFMKKAGLTDTVREHEAILARLRAGDSKGAAERMREHIRAAAARYGVAL